MAEKKMTEALFQNDSYLKTHEARVVTLDDRGVQFDQTIFYATGGGQPGDTGTLLLESGKTVEVTDTCKDRETGEHIHVLSEHSPTLQPGDKVTLQINWERRHRLMRMHSCLHMLCALIDAPVTGGSIQEARGRLDFDLAETVDKEKLTQALNALIQADHTMTTRWITDEELDAQPELVRTMSAPPPRGSGKVRLVNFEGIDLQPCGGTHIKSTAEIGPVRISKIEKKGKQNRRIIVVFDDAAA